MKTTKEEKEESHKMVRTSSNVQDKIFDIINDELEKHKSKDLTTYAQRHLLAAAIANILKERLF